MGQDIGRVPLWEKWIAEWAINELIHYFNLLSLLTLSPVRFFSDRGQIWQGRTMGQDLGRVRSWDTWLFKWALNELIDYFDLLSPLMLSLVRFFFDCGQIW